MNPTGNATADRYTLADLLQVMARLRNPEGGCPWDLAQDFRSIVPSTLEECYELIQAIEDEDFAHVGEELGDLLFQVVFYAQLGAEQGLFDFGDIVHTLVSKLVRRHPHVFADGNLAQAAETEISGDEVKRQWEAIKRQERLEKSKAGRLDDVPLALPALSRAQKLQKRAAGFGFDWPGADAALGKISEELAELSAALAGGKDDEVSEEMGDLLFSCVNVSRKLGLDSEALLRRASSKFERRVRAMERFAAEQGDVLEDLNDSELDRLWNRAKRSGSS